MDYSGTERRKENLNFDSRLAVIEEQILGLWEGNYEGI